MKPPPPPPTSGSVATGQSVSNGAEAVAVALDRLPRSLFVMTAQFEHTRLGVLVQWVQRCASAPVCVSVALLKGHPISPLIRDSHAFALCSVTDADRLLLKKFEHTPGPIEPSPNYRPGVAAPPREDPFMSLDVDSLVTGSPVLRRASTALDLRVMMHLDFESDHEMYIGEVVAARVLPITTQVPPANPVTPPGGAPGGSGNGGRGRAGR